MDLNHHSGALSTCLCLGYQLRRTKREWEAIAFWTMGPTRISSSLLPGNQYSTTQRRRTANLAHCSCRHI